MFVVFIPRCAVSTDLAVAIASFISSLTDTKNEVVENGFLIERQQDALKLLQVCKSIKVSRFRSVANAVEAKSFLSLCVAKFLSPNGDLKSELELREAFLVPGDSKATTDVNKEKSLFHTPKPYEFIALKKAILLDDVKTFGALVFGNPLYLVTSSDTCTILHDGARYNAMHMCAQKNRKMVAHNLINVISSAAFWELLYPNDIDSSRVNRMDYMLDLYLNTPDKHCGETALHFAAKFGFQDMLELISSHPRTSRNPQNINGLKPSQVCGLRCTGFIPKFNIDAGPCYVGCYVSASDLSMFKFKLLSPDFDEKAKSHNDSVRQKRNSLIDFETDFELEAYIGPATEAKCKAIMTDLQKRKRSIIGNYVSKMLKFLSYRKMRFEICRDATVRLKEKFLASDKFLNVSDNLVNLIQQCELFLHSENKKFFNTSISQQLELSFSKLHSKFEELNCSAADSSLGSLTASFANLNIDSSFNQSFNLNDSMMPSVNGSCASILSDTCHDDLSSLDTKFRTWNEFDDSNDDFKTPPASPVANFVDAIDTPFISFCNCEPTEFWQHSELLSVLNNYLISQYFEYVSEHDPTQTESYPLLSSWCQKLKSASSDILADKSTKTSLNCKTCKYCVHEKFNVFASLSDFEFDPFCLYLN